MKRSGVELLQAKVQWAATIWKPWIPPKVSGFSWRALQNCIPVETNIQKLNIFLASKCHCCVQTHECESVDHLMVKSSIAVAVWRFFAAKFHIIDQYSSCIHLFKIWTQRSRANQVGAAKLSIVLFGMWEIWKSRCSAIFEDCPMNAASIISRILHHVQSVMFIFTPKISMDAIEACQLSSLHCQLIPVQIKRGKWLRWGQPSEGTFKLNTDGSSKQGVCTGGGIIRDSFGNMVAAFASSYGEGTNMQGEIFALRDGIRLCRRKNLVSVDIETDSKVVVKAIQGAAEPPWQYVYELNECTRLKGNYALNHIYRECNQVADKLAAYAHVVKDSLEVF